MQVSNFTNTGLILANCVQAIFHRFLNLIIRGSEVIWGHGPEVGKVDSTRSDRSVGLLFPGTDLGRLVGPSAFSSIILQNISHNCYFWKKYKQKSAVFKGKC